MEERRGPGLIRWQRWLGLCDWEGSFHQGRKVDGRGVLVGGCVALFTVNTLHVVEWLCSRTMGSASYRGQWFYKDASGNVQGPFTSSVMSNWPEP